MIFTLLRLYPQSVRSCSKALMLTNGAIAITKGSLPAWASPAATPIRFASLMPTSKNRSGNRFEKGRKELMS